MKNFNIKILVLLLAFGTFMVGCDSDDDDDNPTGPDTKTITELASETDNLSTLVEALKIADLDGTLDEAGTYTVFAPTNDAFQALLDGNDDWNSLSDIPTETLKNVLLFHVLASKVESTDLTDTYVNTLATGPNDENVSLQVQVTGDVMFNGNTMPITTDIEASNGVIHTVDKVMMPPNIVALALNNSNFSILVSALTDGRHTADFVATLNGDGPFTVFAPTDAAFTDLLASNEEWNSLADIPIETLAAVLSYHVVAKDNLVSGDLDDKQTLVMFGGGTVEVDLSDGVVLATSSGQNVNVIIPNVQGTNGVIHAVDKVMLP
jgi:transforming growth factor-beta-induced protein